MPSVELKSYAGVGSRSTPPEFLADMEMVAEALSDQGWILRTGHARGADQAFEIAAASHLCEVYLPWPNFEPNTPVNADFILDRPTRRAYELAEKFHPNWSRLKRGAQALHARNMHQVLGRDLNDPVKFLLCWTERGLETGGTAQAIRCAKAHGVPVYNLAHGETRDRVHHMVESHRTLTEP